MALSEIGDEYMRLLPLEKLDELVAKGTLIEVAYDDEEEHKPNPR